MTRITFPDGFLWGTATSAYQIEGSPLADGACPSNWHQFAHTRGRIRDKTTGDIACDHYRRYEEDVRIMRELGVNAYRFSVAWPRVCPEPGLVNPKGLDFYARLVDRLLENGIRPLVTLFHWDAPMWLERMGGFVNRDSADHLLHYSLAVLRALGDRVKDWVTVNEPSLYAIFGYALGTYPPGRKMDLRRVYHVSHNLLRAHAAVVDAFPSAVKDGRIGFAHHLVWISPASPVNERNLEAAAFMDEVTNRFFMDSLLTGTYPRRVLTRLGRFLPKGFERDVALMQGKMGDYIGINYYTRNLYRYSLLQPYIHVTEVKPPDSPRSAMWEIYPQGIWKALIRLRDEYGNPPCIVTENGYPLPDEPGRDPLVDPERIRYLSNHIALVGKAIEQGVDCRGYFHWSLMDNWEWDSGFVMRFGLMRTDFATQSRTPKASAAWFRKLATENALDVESLPPVEQSRG